MKFLVTTLVGATMLVPSSSAFAQGLGDRDWWYSNWGWGHMAFGGLAMIVFWGAIILLIVLFVRALGWSGNRDAPSQAPRQNAIEILQERFAKGEIDQAEYVERRRVLSEKH